MATMANSSYEELKDSAEIMSVPLAKTILVDLFKALNANREALEAAQAKVAALDTGEQMMGKMREVVPLVVQLLGKRLEYHPGQHKRAKFPTSKAPISAVFHSFWLTFGRAIISRNGLEAWMLFPERARAEHSR